MLDLRIVHLTGAPETLVALSQMLVETVADGGSVSFMHPLSPERAEAFWAASLAAAARGERVVLGAFAGEVLAGTVTLLLDCADNQPHRGEIAKMITRITYRGRGVALALLAAAEALALEKGRTLLVLDTASDGGASGLYERQGYRLAGEIPDYAFKPHGGLSGTLIYWKPLGTPAARPA